MQCTDGSRKLVSELVPQVTKMSYGVCFIQAGLPVPSRVDELLKCCGLDVWTPDYAEADDGHMYGEALCMVIDMPREAGFRVFRLFRDHGVETPVLLIVDAGLEGPLSGLDLGWGLEVVSRDCDPREVLRRVEMLCRNRHKHAGDGERLSA